MYKKKPIQIVLIYIYYTILDPARIFNNVTVSIPFLYALDFFLIDKLMMSTQSWQTPGDTINSIQTNSFLPWWTMMKDLTYSLRCELYEDFKVLFLLSLI